MQHYQHKVDTSVVDNIQNLKTLGKRLPMLLGCLHYAVKQYNLYQEHYNLPFIYPNR